MNTHGIRFNISMEKNKLSRLTHQPFLEFFPVYQDSPSDPDKQIVLLDQVSDRLFR